MCAIAGYLTRSPQPTLDTLFAMSHLMAHRGPDGEGWWAVDAADGRQLSGSSAEGNFFHRLALAHRRYAVMDRSPDGHQPMTVGRLTLVFNGEIYNHDELRHELRSLGAQFRTATDTEVVLAAYQHWGERCFERFRGFFALALHDARSHTLLLARDPLGKAPLYLLERPDGLWFASDIKPLLAACPDERERVSHEAVAHYLHLGWRDVGHRTFWQNIRSLPAATWLRVNTRSGETTTQRYWHFPEKRLTHSELSLPEAAEQLRNLLAQAVSRRLRAALPVGFTLSGGLDSSALVALAAQQSGGGKIPVFTVRYADPKQDESPFARQVVARYADRLEHIVLDGLDQTLADVDAWDSFFNLQEEPFHDPALYTDFVQQQRLKAAGLGVCITGAGGDELLAGYPAFVPTHFRWLMAQPGWGKWPHLAADVVAFFRSLPARELANLVARRWLGIGQSAGFQLLRPTLPYPARLPQDLHHMVLAKMGDEAMHYWLRSTNKHYMGIPMEPRMPFLDVDVVEFCLRLPPDYLIRHGWSKYILRRAVADLLPPAVLWRKRKMGFPFDTGAWLSQNKTDICRLISRDTDNPWLDVAGLIRAYPDLCRRSPQLLWRMVCLSMWYLKMVQQKNYEL